LSLLIIHFLEIQTTQGVKRERWKVLYWRKLQGSQGKIFSLLGNYQGRLSKCKWLL